jgi:hypothetical protein
MMSELTNNLGLPKNDLTSDRSFGSSGAFGSLNNEQKQFFSDYLG